MPGLLEWEVGLSLAAKLLFYLCQEFTSFWRVTQNPALDSYREYNAVVASITTTCALSSIYGIRVIPIVGIESSAKTADALSFHPAFLLS